MATFDIQLDETEFSFRHEWGLQNLLRGTLVNIKAGSC